MEAGAYSVLESLVRSPGDYLPVDAAAQASGLDVSEVRSHVDDLNRLGVPVDFHPVYGVRVPIAFDLIDRDAVRDQLLSHGLDWDVEGCLEVGSTNDLAGDAALRGAADGTTFFAEHQTKGRGRLGRMWHSPVGSGLWFSVLRLHDLPIDSGWRVTLGAGVAVSAAIEKLTLLKPRLKWPNDVQIDGRKVAGILTESRTERDRLRQSVVGIGVNVHLGLDEFPEELRTIACSIASEGGRVTRGDLLVEILKGLSESLNMDPETLRRAWSERCSHWGERVRVERDCDTVEGRAIELAVDGAFVIETDEGSRYSVHAGDVTHLRMTT